MATSKNSPGSPESGRKRLSLKIAAVEYRVQCNVETGAWDVLRNGSTTDVTARKKQKSAMDSAIRDAKTECDASREKVVVTCRQGQKIQTLWKGA
jgi:hypothetical protein